MSCFILRCDIDGFVEVVNRLFPPVSVSLSVCWRLCATLHSFIYYCHYTLTLSVSPFPPCTTLYLTLSFFISCPSLAGAKDLQSPPQSVFLSFPTSLYRPRGPRRFCFKLSVKAGPTAWSTEPPWRSAKACSMRFTKLQVNNVLYSRTYEVNWACLFFHCKSLMHNNQVSYISDP